MNRPPRPRLSGDGWGSGELEEASTTAALVAAQELQAVSNRPSTSYGWPFAASTEDDTLIPPLRPDLYPEVGMDDFQSYIQQVAPGLQRMQAVSGHGAPAWLARPLEELEGFRGQGLVAALKEVPPHFFSDAFDFDSKELWTEMPSVDDKAAQVKYIEKLGQYLDTVEAQLTLESAARATSIFEAGLRVGSVTEDVRGAARLSSDLRAPIAALARDWGAHLRRADELLAQRARAQRVLNTARALEEAEAARGALSGLLYGVGTQGAVVDYASILDVVDLLRGAMTSPDLAPLHCLQGVEEQADAALRALHGSLVADTLALAGLGDPRGRAIAELAMDRCRGVLQEAQDAAARGGRASEAAQSFGAAPLGLQAVSGATRDDVCALLAETETASPARADAGALLAALARTGQLPTAVSALERACAATLDDGLADLLSLHADMAQREPSALRGAPSNEAPKPGATPPGSADKLPAFLDAIAFVSCAALERSRAAYGQLESGVERCAGPGDADSVLARRTLEASRRETERRLQDGAVAAWVRALGARTSLLATGGRPAPSAPAGPGQARQLGEAAMSEVQVIGSQTVHLCELIALPVGSRPAAQLRNAVQMHCRAVLERMHGAQLALLNGNLERDTWVQVPVPASVQALAEALERAAAEIWRSAKARTAADDREVAAAGEGTLEPGHVAMPSKTQDSESGSAADQSARPAPLRIKTFEGKPDGAVSPAALTAASPRTPSRSTPRASPRRSPAAGGLPPRPPGLGPASPQAEQLGLGSHVLSPRGSPPAVPGGRESPRAAVPRKFTLTVGAVPAAPGTDSSAEPSAPSLAVCGQAFACTASLVTLLGALGEYAELAAVAPAAAGETASRALELLKAYNSRACQLVLGAGAMQVAGLRSITARHLALAARGVCALAALTEPLAAVLVAPVGAGAASAPAARRRDQLLAGFRRAAEDMRHHASEVCAKFVSIMSDRLEANLEGLAASVAQAAAAGAEGPTPVNPPALPPPSPFAATMSKQLSILANVLGPLLSAEQLESVFGRVAGLYARKAADAFGLLEAKRAHAARQRQAPDDDRAWWAQVESDARALLACLEGLPVQAGELKSLVEPLASWVNWRFVIKRRLEAERAAATAEAKAARFDAERVPPSETSAGEAIAPSPQRSNEDNGSDSETRSAGAIGHAEGSDNDDDPDAQLFRPVSPGSSPLKAGSSGPLDSLHLESEASGIDAEDAGATGEDANGKAPFATGAEEEAPKARESALESSSPEAEPGQHSSSLSKGDPLGVLRAPAADR